MRICLGYVLVIAVLFGGDQAVEDVWLGFLFFFLMIRRPPGSPPFPYTTLFRSLRQPKLPRPRQPQETHGASSALTCDIDRKSTRLNSSHLVISYAVFCLKKK